MQHRIAKSRIWVPTSCFLSLYPMHYKIRAYKNIHFLGYVVPVLTDTRSAWSHLRNRTKSSSTYCKSREMYHFAATFSQVFVHAVFFQWLDHWKLLCKMLTFISMPQRKLFTKYQSGKISRQLSLIMYQMFDFN